MSGRVAMLWGLRVQCRVADIDSDNSWPSRGAPTGATDVPCPCTLKRNNGMARRATPGLQIQQCMPLPSGRSCASPSSSMSNWVTPLLMHFPCTFRDGWCNKICLKQQQVRAGVLRCLDAQQNYTQKLCILNLWQNFIGLVKLSVSPSLPKLLPSASDATLPLLEWLT